ncbi:fatty acid desaturase-domain-containing protein [Pavlovales sp. CCMP2436]|nr:fatty acid desaturase-domain-containing protein [Pavlovales sp. CCMP2436]
MAALVHIILLAAHLSALQARTVGRPVAPPKPTLAAASRALPVRIDGSWYDLGQWAEAHPGGAWLLHYHRGRDVTALFHSIHLRSSSRAAAILGKMTRLEPEEVEGARPFTFERSAALSGTPAPIVGEGARVFVLARSAFALELQQLVDEEFPTPQSTKADALHWLRIWAALGLCVASWTGWTFGDVPSIAALPLCAWALASQTTHEATHSLLSTKPWVNYICQFTAHPLFFNVFCWIPEHLTSHHQYTNDAAYDVDVHLFAPVRINAGADALPHAAPFLGTRGYTQFLVKGALSTLGTSVLQPMRALLELQTPNFGANITPVPSDVTKEMLALSMAPALMALLWPFLALALGLVPAPVALLQLVWPWVGASIIWTTMTQVSHIQAETQTDQPAIPSAADAPTCWWARQAETSLDYSAGLPLVTALSAGLNTQSLHHTLPMVCSCHYPRIYARYAQICARHGVRLQSVPDLGAAIGGLVSFIRQMNPPEPAPKGLLGVSVSGRLE